MLKTQLSHSLMILTAGAAVIGAAELTARYAGFGDPPVVLLDNRIGYYLAPSRSYTRFGHDIRVNRYGMRSDDVDIAATDRRFSFSLLGDSIVYGNRLDQADTPSAQLQNLLMAAENAHKVLVNSIAASSWGPENLLEFYRRFGPFPGNTAWIVQNTGDMVDVIDPVNNDVPYRMVSPYGALHDLALSTWRGITLRVLPRNTSVADLEDRRRRADLALHALITALGADYTRVVLVFHATKDEALSGRDGGLAHYQRIARERAIGFISTMELYAQAYRSNAPPHYDDVHLSKTGAHILAERLAADVEQAKRPH
jgi:hypothetical protein